MSACGRSGCRERGDAQLVDLAKRFRAQLIALGEQMTTRGGDLADPQEVVDRLFQCVSGEPTVHNPTGSDAEMLIGMMGQNKLRPSWTSSTGC